MNSIIADLSSEIAEYLEMNDAFWNKMCGTARIVGIDMKFQKTPDYIEIECCIGPIKIDRFTYQILPLQRS